MRRQTSAPRPNWQLTVAGQGLHYHTSDGQAYWDESVYYEFDAPAIDMLEKATLELNDLCLKAVEEIIAHDWFGLLQVPPAIVPYVVKSWEEEDNTLYGRFDFAFDGVQPPKLLEYNADTPTALLEAAVIQWFWLKDVQPAADQFNPIHDRLLEAWKSLRAEIEGSVYFTALRGQLEDYMTVNYLRDTAMQAGLETRYIDVENIGWHPGRRQFTDVHEEPIRTSFKLYPWEWMFREAFGRHLAESPTRWLEPPWKCLLSNKGLLPILYELNPNCPYLLKASFEPFGNTYVAKPIHGREGANITVVENGKPVVSTEGPYDGPCVYQEYHPLPCFDGHFYPVVGSWLVNGYACGIGIREDNEPITQNASRFVPHFFHPPQSPLIIPAIPPSSEPSSLPLP